ncbi:MAG TPA: rod shape-determining protein MreC, partial [Myxococcota bacterium]
GVVLTVGRYSSDVLVLTDPASAIDVVVQRSRARGIIRGRGDDDKYAAVVEDFDRLREVEPGDDVVTSGIGARFPVGLLVGRIVDVDDADDLTVRALIKPAVDISRVEHVAVLVGREMPKAPALGDEDVQLPPPIRRVRRAPKGDDVDDNLDELELETAPMTPAPLLVPPSNRLDSGAPVEPS